MSRTFRHYCFCLAQAACVVAAPMTMAQELQDPRDKANRICASYGQGFVAGPAPGNCVKVSERLRVAPSARRAGSDEPMQGFVSVQDAPLRDRLRITGGFGGASIR